MYHGQAIQDWKKVQATHFCLADWSSWYWPDDYGSVLVLHQLMPCALDVSVIEVINYITFTQLSRTFEKQHGSAVETLFSYGTNMTRAIQQQDSVLTPKQALVLIVDTNKLMIYDWENYRPHTVCLTFVVLLPHIIEVREGIFQNPNPEQIVLTTSCQQSTTVRKLHCPDSTLSNQRNRDEVWRRRRKHKQKETADVWSTSVKCSK